MNNHKFVNESKDKTGIICTDVTTLQSAKNSTNDQPIIPECDRCNSNIAVVDQIDNFWCANCQHIIKKGGM